MLFISIISFFLVLFLLFLFFGKIFIFNRIYLLTFPIIFFILLFIKMWDLLLFLVKIVLNFLAFVLILVFLAQYFQIPFAFDDHLHRCLLDLGVFIATLDLLKWKISSQECATKTTKMATGQVKIIYFPFSSTKIAENHLNWNRNTKIIKMSNK